MSDVVIAIIAVVAGSLMCFEGYKLFRLSLGIAGGVAGFVIARYLIGFTGDMGINWNETGKLVVLALFTIGLGVLAFTLYMKALIAITTIVCALWFYDDFNFLFERVSNNALRIVITFGAGLVAGVLIGIIVYYAQKWTISLFTAFVGARMISGVLAPILWSGILSGEYVGIIEQRVLGSDVGVNYSLVRVLLLVAFCTAGFVIQLKTSKK
ncbi:MAG: hypothetical protein IKG03_04345 [Clostridiales bacterium]|nr:hypothetical protein [Clostridiales bacterium]